MNPQPIASSEPQSLSTVIRAFEARRKYPRIRMSLPIRVGLPGGTVIVAHTKNMTPEGLQIRCDRKAAETINPGGHDVPVDANSQLMVMMRMESPDEVHSCVLRCRWSYMVADKDEDDVVFGLEFTDPSPEQTQALDTVFAHALRPA